MKRVVFAATCAAILADGVRGVGANCHPWWPGDQSTGCCRRRRRGVAGVLPPSRWRPCPRHARRARPHGRVRGRTGRSRSTRCRRAATSFRRSPRALSDRRRKSPCRISTDVRHPLEALEVPGGEPPSAASAGGQRPTPQALLNRIKALEQRISELESGTVLSEPETRVKRIEVYVDQNGNEHDEPSRAPRRRSPTSGSGSTAGSGSARSSNRRSRDRGRQEDRGRRQRGERDAVRAADQGRRS